MSSRVREMRMREEKKNEKQEKLQKTTEEELSRAAPPEYLGHFGSV